MAGDLPLDPVTFEVLKNSFITSVDQMGEQVLRTCYSFVIYNRDFSSALHDAKGECAAQGNQDIAVHVGTLHFTCKDVMRFFDGDMHEGDVFAINDPYAGGTHFPDVRLIRPIFADGKIIAFSQSNGHWSDVGGSVPGSFDVAATRNVPRGPAHHADPPVRQGPLLQGRRASDRLQHAAIRPRSSATSRRSPRPPRSANARSCASSTNTVATRSRPGLPPCRTMSNARCGSASQPCPMANGRRSTSSTAIPPAAKA